MICRLVLQFDYFPHIPDVSFVSRDMGADVRAVDCKFVFLVSLVNDGRMPLVAGRAGTGRKGETNRNRSRQGGCVRI